MEMLKWNANFHQSLLLLLDVNQIPNVPQIRPVSTLNVWILAIAESMPYVQSSTTNLSAIVPLATPEILKWNVRNWNVKLTPIVELIKSAITTNVSILAYWTIHVQSMPSVKLKIMLHDVSVHQDWLAIPTSIVKLWNVTSTVIVTPPKPVFKTNVWTLASWTMFAPQPQFAELSIMMPLALVLQDT